MATHFPTVSPVVRPTFLTNCADEVEVAVDIADVDDAILRMHRVIASRARLA